jgi:dTDP-glucose 4,6-dehydratase
MAMFQALEGGVVNQTLHFGSNVRKKNIEVVETMLKLMSAPSSLINFVPDRPGHDRAYALNYGKTTDLLGWQPQQDFEEGLKIVIDDVKDRLNHGKTICTD